MNGVRGNMAVVVNMRNNKHYVHRILTPDGSEFVFDVKRKDTEPTSGEPSSSDKRAPIGSASKKSIAQETDSVNSKSLVFKNPIYNLLLQAKIPDKKRMQNEKCKGECPKGLLPMPQVLHPI